MKYTILKIKAEFTWTRFIILLTVLIYIIQLISQIFTARYMNIYIPGQNYIIIEFWRNLTSIFLHSVSNPLHLIMNMWSLYTIGDEVEKSWGKSKMLIVYVASGIFASIFSMMSQYLFYPLIPKSSLGASGAIFGLLGFIAIQLYTKERILAMKGISPLIDKKSLAIFIIFNFILGFTIPQIDNSAHLGGFISGAILGLLL